jgi:hypothetical protein
MNFVGIVALRLVSGSYYCEGGASNINPLKTSKSTWHSAHTSQRTPRAWSKIQSPTAVYVSGCLLWDSE